MPVEPTPPPARRLLSEAAPPHWRADALAGVRHGFFGRRGGVSSGIYASLNAGTGSNDDASAVRENRARIAAAFETQPERLLGVHQVHSPTAVLVDAPWTNERPHADALVTRTPGLVLTVLTADCTPILFADCEAGVIGATHAGWKGALGGVIENTVALMCAEGAQLGRITAVIGPCIHQNSYEVGPEFLERFAGEDNAYAHFFTPGAGDRYFFDLPGFCADRLSAAGIARKETLPLDTYAEPASLFSHRRSVHEKAGDYGRNCAAISLG
ncbi:MAG: peptidoglycan editing factor PgeF [Hyphomonadaceae bacterium]